MLMVIKKQTLALLFSLSLFFFTVLTVRAVPVLVHQPPTDAREGKSIAIQATVSDSASSIAQVKLYYRVSGTLGFREQILRGTGLTYAGSISGKLVRSAGVEYYLQARNQANEIVTSPPLNAAVAPHRIIVREVTIPPVVTLLSPEVNSVLGPEDVVLVIHMDAGKSEVDLSTLKVVFDEKDITAQVEKTTTMLSYVMPEKLAPGLHGLQVTVRNTEGMETKTATLSFEISETKKVTSWQAEAKKAEKESAFQLRGNIGAQLQYVGLSKVPAVSTYIYQPKGFLNRLNVNFMGQAGDLNLLGTAYITSEETPGQQPINRFRLDMVTPAIVLSLGDVYPTFTDFTLSNAFIRGGYFRWIMGDVDQGHSELLLTGGFNRMAIAGFTSADPDQERSGTFERWMGGFRWLSDFISGIGFSLNTSAAIDNSASLSEDQWGGTYPYWNAVGTGELHIKIPFTSSFFSKLYGEYGMSAYFEEGDEELFVNPTTLTAGDALRGGTRWEWGNYHSFVSCEYKQVGANFVTAGNPWMIGDSKGIDGDAQIYLLGSNLILMADVQVYDDNLNNQKDYDVYIETGNNTITVNATTSTTFISGMVSYRMQPYFSNLSIGYSLNNQKDKTTPVSIIDNRTTVLTLGAGSSIPLNADQIIMNLTYTRSGYTDMAESPLSGNISTSSFLGSAMYIRNLWSVSCGFGLNSSLTDESAIAAPSSYLMSYVGKDRQTIDYTLLNLRANVKLIPGFLDLGLSLENLGGQDDIDWVENNLFTVGISSRYYFSSTHSLSLTLSSIGYTDKKTDENSYEEFVATLNYALGF